MALVSRGSAKEPMPEATEFPNRDRRDPEELILYRLGRVEALAEHTAGSLDRLQTQVTRLLGAVAVIATIAMILAAAIATQLVQLRGR